MHPFSLFRNPPASTDLAQSMVRVETNTLLPPREARVGTGHAAASETIAMMSDADIGLSPKPVVSTPLRITPNMKHAILAPETSTLGATTDAPIPPPHHHAHPHMMIGGASIETAPEIAPQETDLRKTGLQKIDAPEIDTPVTAIQGIDSPGRGP